MTEELKYPHEWFELLKNEIPQPFRFEIEDNLDKEYENYEKCEKDIFIQNAFAWNRNAQKIQYWDNVDDCFNNGTLQQLADRVNEERWNNLKVGDTLYGIVKDSYPWAKFEKFMPNGCGLAMYYDVHIHISKDTWFNKWTPIKPKHWKEEVEPISETSAAEKSTVGLESVVNAFRDRFNEGKKIIEEMRPEWILSEENAINLLKSKGYKILKPTTNYEEI